MAWVAPNKLKADSTTIINGVEVKNYLLKDHNVNNVSLPSKRYNKFKGVVIHNTNRANSADDGRQYTAATLNGAMASRTHYYVTELGAWKNLEDDDMNWTCGDGIVGEGNNGCISLEIIMDSKNKTVDLKARENGARIAAWILFKNNMTVDNMYTHNYFLNIRDGVKGDYNKLCTSATPTRNCPYFIVWDWEGFRKQVNSYITKLKELSKPIANTSKAYVYKAVSQAAIREGMSKTAKLINRVVKGNYYIVEEINDKWLKHVGTNNYSMLVDGGALFKKVGEAITKVASIDLHIKPAPSSKEQSLYTLKKGTIIYVLKNASVTMEGYVWDKVVINNKIGYVISNLLKSE